MIAALDRAFRWGLAAALALAALGITRITAGPLGAPRSFIELAAVAIAALAGGAGPALLTGALCAAGHALLFVRGEAFPQEGWALLAFVLTALLIAAVGGALDRARRRRVAALEGLHEAEQRAEELERFVLEAGGVLAESLHYEQVLERLARLAVPRLADACQIDTVEPGGPVRLVALAHTEREREAVARELRLRFPPDPGRSPLWRAIRGGEPLLVPAVDDDFLFSIASGPDHLRRLRAAGFRSLVVVPLVTRGAAVGALTLVTDASGRTLGPADVAVARELARRAAHAVENARLYREAQRAVRQRDEVLAIVSHDLRTPLGAILMSARAIAAADADVVRARRSASTIERAARGMSRLISDLLDLASLDAGRLSISRRPEDPASLVREAAELVRPGAENGGLDLHVEAPEGLPAVSCDRDRALQVLGNLLANALKATEAGFVAVRARAEGGAVVFEVEDSGPGIAEEDLPHVFDAFRRARGAAYHGTGLGLSIVRGLVEAHGGAVWVRSRVGEGSIFAFTIPVAHPLAVTEARTGEGAH